MKIFKGIFLVLATVLMDQSVSADSAVLDNEKKPYWSEGAWAVYSYPEEEMCEMAADTYNGEMFTFASFPKRGGFTFLMTNRKATSLSDGDVVNLEIIFLRNNRIDNGWGTRRFNVQKTDGLVLFLSPLLPHPIDEDIAKATHIGLFRTSSNGEPVLVAGIELPGSSKAIPKLRECAFDAANLNADDPFLK